VRRIARRLDRNAATLEAVGQNAFGNEFVEHSVEERGILGVKAQTEVTGAGKCAPLAQPQPRVTLAGMLLAAALLRARLIGRCARLCDRSLPPLPNLLAQKLELAGQAPEVLHHLVHGRRAGLTRLGCPTLRLTRRNEIRIGVLNLGENERLFGRSRESRRRRGAD
jgi:hypothetical protein